MRLNLRLSGPTRFPPSALLIAFLLIGVVAPAAAVYWFMNEAARSQAEAARRGMIDAYRGQLALLRDRLESSWRTRASALAAEASMPARARADRLRMASDADAIVVLDTAGKPIYSNLEVNPRVESFVDSPQWMDALALESQPEQLSRAASLWGSIANSTRNPARSAQAAQNQVRCLVRIGDKKAALAAIRRWFMSGPTAQVADGGGRLIAADEQLLAFQLVNRNDPAFLSAARTLAALLDNTLDMPPAQRLFVMDEIRKVAPDFPPFASYDAERLAFEYVATEQPHRAGAGMQSTLTPDIWQLVSADTTAVALYRTATIIGLSERLLREQNTAKNAHFTIHRPGATAGQDAAALGMPLPGWQISTALSDPHLFDEAAKHRTRAYFLLGSTVIAAIAVAGLLAGDSLRRQMRLTRLKTDLVAAVSHELRTPLASMSLLLENLLAEKEFDTQKTREYLELIAGENERLRRLIQNFLTFSRTDRRRQTFRFEPLSPATVAESALYSMRDRFNGHVQLRFEASPSLPRIRGDQDALVTVLLNLLDNAWKYTNEEKQIALRVFAEQHHVAFSVSDNGIGIPAREQRKIFRRFYRVDRRLARETGGCGLGLSIVDDLVRAHGGTVTVKSAIGSGSTFEVRIPCWEDGRAA